MFSPNSFSVKLVFRSQFRSVKSYYPNTGVNNWASQGINFGWLRANFPRNVFRETSQNNCCPAKCAKEIEILSEIFKSI